MKKALGILYLTLLLGCPAQEDTVQNTAASGESQAKTAASPAVSPEAAASQGENSHSHTPGGEAHSHDTASHSEASGTHDHNKAPHGGILMDKDGEHWELVVHADHLDLFLLDGEMKTLSLQGASAELLIQGSTGTRSIALLPEAENLMGKGVFDPSKESAVLTLKRDGKTQMLRFGQ